MYDAWDASKFNLVFHSSGYDSRVISWMVRKIHNEKGGNVLFVCFPPELELMRDIMYYEGWDSSQIAFYDDYLTENTDTFNFSTLHEQFNGISMYPLNRPYCCVEYLKKAGIIPHDNLLIWGGGFFNEIAKAKSTVNDFISRYYYHQYSKNITVIKNYIMPVTNFKTMKVFFESMPVTDANSLRLDLVRLLDKGLSELPRGTWYSPNTRIHVKVYNKLVQDYKNSFYYKNTKGVFEPSPFVANNKDWWYKCCLASFIDRCIRNGVEVVL
jgi:hypothetical protein